MAVGGNRLLSSRRASRGAIAILDQILHSGAHFVLGLAVARSGTVAQLGLFGLIMLCIHTSQDFHKAIVWLPMTQVSKAGQLRMARRMSVWGGMSLGILTLLLLASLSLAGVAHWGRAPWMLGFLIPVLWLHEIQRRICFAKLHPARALVADGVYVLSIAATLVLLHREWVQWDPVTRVLGALATGGVLAVISGFISLRDLPPSDTSMSILAQRYWRLGKAYLANAGLVVASQRAGIFVIGAVLGVEAVGNVEAARLLVAPLSVAVVGLASIVVPDICRSIWVDSVKETARLMKKWSLVAILIALAYGTVVLLNLRWVSGLLLDQQYANAATLVGLLCGVALTSLLVTILMAPLGSEDAASTLPRARVPGVLLAVLLFVPLALFVDERGVVALLLLEGLVTTGLLIQRRVARRGA